MQELFDKLLALLRAEYDQYSEMLEVSKLKKSVIADGKIDELDKIIKHEQAFLVRINDIEQKRAKLVTEIAKSGNIYKKDVTIADIIKTCDEARKAEFKIITDKLTKTLKEQTDYNDINRKMITDRLEYINYMLSHTKAVPEQNNNYGAGGIGVNQGERKKSSMIDHKA